MDLKIEPKAVFDAYSKHQKNKLVKICEGFSRINFFSKKECTGRTRLMRQEYRPKRRAKITKLFF